MLHRFLILWNVISTGSHQSLGMHWRLQNINWTKKIYWNTMNQTGMNYFKKVRHRVSEFKISRYVYPWRIIFKFKIEVFNRVVCRQVSRSESWIQWKIWVLRSDTNIWLIEDWLRCPESNNTYRNFISPSETRSIEQIGTMKWTVFLLHLLSHPCLLCFICSCHFALDT